MARRCPERGHFGIGFGKGVVLLAILGMVAGAGVASAQADACAAPEARQLDFWLGTWSVSWTEPDGTRREGVNVVERVLGGCVVEERFEGPVEGRPYAGRRWSMWVPGERRWRQQWVDNGGSWLDFTGERSAGRMVFERETTLPDGRRVRQRMVFRDLARDSFVWDWETSSDAGTTWRNRWRIDYRRR